MDAGSSRWSQRQHGIPPASSSPPAGESDYLLQEMVYRRPRRLCRRLPAQVKPFPSTIIFCSLSLSWTADRATRGVGNSHQISNKSQHDAVALFNDALQNHEIVIYW